MVDRTGSNNSFPTCSEIRDIQRIQTSGEIVISAIYRSFFEASKPLISPETVEKPKKSNFQTYKCLILLYANFIKI